MLSHALLNPSTTLPPMLRSHGILQHLHCCMQHIYRAFRLSTTSSSPAAILATAVPATTSKSRNLCAPEGSVPACAYICASMLRLNSVMSLVELQPMRFCGMDWQLAACSGEEDLLTAS